MEAGERQRRSQVPQNAPGAGHPWAAAAGSAVARGRDPPGRPRSPTLERLEIASALGASPARPGLGPGDLSRSVLEADYGSAPR